MRTNRVKEKLKQGEPVLGAWLSLPSVPEVCLLRIGVGVSPWYFPYRLLYWCDWCA